MTGKIDPAGFSEFVSALTSEPLPRWQLDLIDKIAALPPGARITFIPARCPGRMTQTRPITIDDMRAAAAVAFGKKPGFAIIDEATDITPEMVEHILATEPKTS